MATETTDVLIIGTGFGGSIPGYYLAAGGARVIMHRQLDPDDCNVAVGTGRIEARVVIVAAGAMGTPVILQRSKKFLGRIPAAVGRHFSANGDRITMAALDEGKVRDLLGLERAPGVAYDAFPIGKPIAR